MTTENIEQLRAELQKLQRSAVDAHSRSVAGDKAAAARRAQLMDEVAFVNVRIAEAVAADEVERGAGQAQRLKDAAEASRAYSASIAATLEPRIALGSRADELIAELGAVLTELQRAYDQGQGAVARGMRAEEALSLLWGHDALAHAAIGALFRSTGWDSSVLAGLSSNGMSLLPQSEPLAVVAGHQNALLNSLREQHDLRIAMAIEAFEAQKVEEVEQ
ncbi:hypothetical protein [Paraburkholderia dipogonis]|uniref:hypothetical protein n=1 Tax=Paraburkholderia dipogonis TaxID=1211383 RepID=UPI0038B98967